VFEAAGHTVVYKNVPWKRAIAGARSGLYTGILGALKKEASDFVYPEEELGQDIIAFYVRKNSVWRFEGAASIEHVSIGVAAGYDYRDWLNTYIQTHSGNDRRVQVVSGIDPLKQNLKKLLYKRIDVLVGNEAAIRYKAKSMGFMNKIRPAGYGREPANLYISFSPNLPESQMLARQLSDGIAELRRYGQLKTILDRYDLDDWK
jgi:polar amino acid transport system substrate-binding protein